MPITAACGAGEALADSGTEVRTQLPPRMVCKEIRKKHLPAQR